MTAVINAAEVAASIAALIGLCMLLGCVDTWLDERAGRHERDAAREAAAVDAEFARITAHYEETG